MGSVLRERRKSSEKRSEGKSEKGNTCGKAQADIVFSSFVRSVFVFPKPLFSAEQCILYCFFTLTANQEGRKQMVGILFLRLFC